jgi:hypothetical protein
VCWLARRGRRQLKSAITSNHWGRSRPALSHIRLRSGALQIAADSVESWHDRFGHPRQERTEQHPSNSSRWARWRTGSQSDGAREGVQAVVVAYESGLVRPEGS